MKKKILITGARGLLGSNLVEFLSPRFDVLGTTSQSGSSTLTAFEYLTKSADELARFLEEQEVSHVAHFAALSDVEKCEQEKEAAHFYNVECTKKLVQTCNLAGSQLIFASTNAVYDGSAPPYDEESIRKPMHIYGLTKMLAEDFLLENSKDFVILRFILAIGQNPAGSRNNPLTNILTRYSSGQRVFKMVNDVFANTLYAKDASKAVFSLLEKKIKNEVFNIGGATKQSRYDLALSIKEIFDLSEMVVEAVSSEAFSNLVRRPKDTTFSCRKAMELLDYAPLQINDALTDVAKKRDRPTSQNFPQGEESREAFLA